MIQYILLCLLTGSLITTSAQQIDVNGIFKVTLPAKAEKLVGQQLKTAVNEKTSYAKFLKNKKTFKGQYYKIDEILLQLNAGRTTVAKDYLSQIKYGFDDAAGKNSKVSPAGYSSEIKTINNNQVLIIHNEWKEWNSYTFILVNSNGTSTLSGGMDYEKSNENKLKAENVLKTILHSVKTN